MLQVYKLGRTPSISSLTLCGTTDPQIDDRLSDRAAPCTKTAGVTIEPDELIPGRRASRARVVAAGLNDDDIDRLIKQAQRKSNRVLDEGGPRHQRPGQRGA